MVNPRDLAANVEEEERERRWMMPSQASYLKPITVH